MFSVCAMFPITCKKNVKRLMKRQSTTKITTTEKTMSENGERVSIFNYVILITNWRFFSLVFSDIKDF
jgi:hypothetical protein